MGKKKETRKEDPKDIKLNELTDTLQRLQADFENYKKRVERDKADFAKFACDSVIVDILGVLDNFELALKNKDKLEEFQKGVELIYSELFSMLEKRGLKEIEALGGKFDPHLHEALMQDKKEGTDPGIIIDVFQKGYTLNGRVVRFSKVKVSK